MDSDEVIEPDLSIVKEENDSWSSNSSLFASNEDRTFESTQSAKQLFVKLQDCSSYLNNRRSVSISSKAKQNPKNLDSTKKRKLKVDSNVNAKNQKPILANGKRLARSKKEVVNNKLATNNKVRKYSRRSTIREEPCASFSDVKKTIVNSGCTLGSIPGLRSKLMVADQGLLLIFYQVLNLQWRGRGFSRNSINHILQFNGFPDDEQALHDRSIFLLSLEDTEVKSLCDLIGLKHGTKEAMVPHIVNFLKCPTKTLDPAVDINYQPVIPLTRLKLKSEEIKQASVKCRYSTASTAGTTKRKLRNVNDAYYGAYIVSGEETDDAPETAEEYRKKRRKKSLGNRGTAPSHLLNRQYSIEKTHKDTTWDNMKGKPLSSFPQIVESITSANPSVLQRLHLHIFGTTDKKHNPQVIKQEILKFDGIHSSPDSEDPTFLLSLASPSIWKEYCDILQIDVPTGNSSVLWDHLSKFLKQPCESMLRGNKVPPIVVRAQTIKQDQKKSPGGIHRKNRRTKNMKKKWSRKKCSTKIESKAEPPDYSVYEIVDGYARIKKEPTICEPKKQVEEQFIQTMKSQKDDTYFVSTYQKNADHNNAYVKSMLRLIHKNRDLIKNGLEPHTIPGSHEKVKISEITHAKFMIVTLHFQDLEIIHSVIFLEGCSKARIRRNILDFDGFHFKPNCFKYGIRKMVLLSLGYTITKRISFIMGLTPISTKIPHEDLSDLLIHFLMAPSRIKPVPIGMIPQNFFQDYPKDIEMGNVLKGLSLSSRSAMDQSIIDTLSNAIRSKEKSQQVAKDVPKKNKVEKRSVLKPKPKALKSGQPMETNFRITAPQTSPETKPQKSLHSLLKDICSASSSISIKDSSTSEDSILEPSTSQPVELFQPKVTQVRSLSKVITQNSTFFGSMPKSPSKPSVDFSKLHTLTKLTIKNSSDLKIKTSNSIQLPQKHGFVSASEISPVSVKSNKTAGISISQNNYITVYDTPKMTSQNSSAPIILKEMSHVKSTSIVQASGSHYAYVLKPVGEMNKDPVLSGTGVQKFAVANSSNSKMPILIMNSQPKSRMQMFQTIFPKDTFPVTQLSGGNKQAIFFASVPNVTNSAQFPSAKLQPMPVCLKADKPPENLVELPKDNEYEFILPDIIEPRSVCEPSSDDDVTIIS